MDNNFKRYFMQKSTAGFIVLLLAALTLTMAGCAAESKSKDTPPKAASVKVMDYTVPSNLKQLIDSSTDHVVIDVRTPEEYQEGHIPTAVNIPYDIIADNLPSENKDELIVLYCRSGRRAEVALGTLTNLGYTRVVNFGAAANWSYGLVTQ